MKTKKKKTAPKKPQGQWVLMLSKAQAETLISERIGLKVQIDPDLTRRVNP